MSANTAGNAPILALLGSYVVGQLLGPSAARSCPFAAMQGSGLPSLLQSRLNAPRVLRVNKVADYVRRKMEEHGIQLREEPLFWDPAKAERWQTEAGAAQPDAGAAAGVHQLQPVGGGACGAAGQPAAILITCKGHTVPWDFSLAAVRQWIWRRSDDLVLHYSVRDERTPLRLPAIRPPS